MLGQCPGLNKSLAHIRPKLKASKFRFGPNLMNVHVAPRSSCTFGA